MAATTSGYGAYNPAAVDPYPIETDLAKLAVGNSPENAANLLDLYQLQRTTDAANYGHEMGVQHDFARQQLAQQLQEQYLKSGQEALKTPGGISLMNSQAPGSLGTGFGPGQINTIETNLGNAQQAGTFEKAAGGAYHAVQAGFPPDLTGLKSLTGGLLNTQGTPLALQVEGMKQAGQNARHAAGAAADARPGFSAQLPSDPANPDVTWNMTVPRKGGMTPQQALDYAQRNGIYKPRVITSLPDKGTPNPPGDKTGTTPSGPSAPNNTRLAPNTNRAPVAPTVQGGMDMHKAAESYVENKLRIENPAAYADAVAGKVGGKLNVQMGSDGRPYIQGKEGRH